MATKFGLDGTNYQKGRRARTKLQRPGDVVTISFQASALQEAEAAWSENLPVPGIVSGEMVEVLPNGKVRTKSKI